MLQYIGSDLFIFFFYFFRWARVNGRDGKRSAFSVLLRSNELVLQYSVNNIFSKYYSRFSTPISKKVINPIKNKKKGNDIRYSTL